MARAKESGTQTLEHRRSSGLLRIPFVHRCALDFEGGRSAEAFLVNVNVHGAYIASDEMPNMGEGVVCRFTTPDNALEIVAGGIVAWLNPHQSHPVHSLPPGFGVRFERLTGHDRGRIEGIVRTYIQHHAYDRR